MKKVFSVAAIAVLFSTSALAADVDAKLSGTFDFRAGFKKQSKLSDPAGKLMTPNHKNYGFESAAEVRAEVSGAGDNGVIYGGRVVITPTAQEKSGSKYNGSYLFLESDAGRVELGSNYGAASKLRIDAYSITAATGDGWSDFIYSDESGAVGFNGASYVKSTDFFTDNMKSSMWRETPRKITYITPEVYGFNAAVSYMPDTENLGEGSLNSKYNDASKYNMKYADFVLGQKKGKMFTKDTFTGGLSWRHDVSDATSVKLSATGEYGNPAQKKVDVAVAGPADVRKVRKLASYNLGAQANIENFSVAGSYGSWNKSFLVKGVENSKHDTKFYSGAVAYNQGPVGASVAYFNSDHRKNKLQAVTVGTDYKLMPGLLPYAEVTYFTAKPGKAAAVSAKVRKTNGTVAIVGAKLQF